MKTKILALFGTLAIMAAGCSKSHNPDPDTTSATLEAQVLTDFPANLANPNYLDIETKAGIMKDAAGIFISSSTDANLKAVQDAWKNTRAAWESCEGYLFGPVEDFNYDPTMDDWPVNKVDLDALLASSNQLSVSDIEDLGTTLKGFHAIEYVIFGVGGTKKAAQVTEREKTYLASLTESLYNTTRELRASWDPSVSGNFTHQVTTAGNGSARFATRQDFFKALVGAMADICNEVADEKMQTPLAAQDSTLDESSFSHNSVTDFTNNIKGVLNAYNSSYNGTSGHSLSELVKAKNISLDAKIQSQITAAISSFSLLNGITYEKAIYDNKDKINQIQTAIRTLKETLEGDLDAFVETNIKD
ncbi:MAG TPA: imelysin family protein [Mucilaginibacter sp.]|nr:imelysin family protein [Mucilaginibacter sp.]